MGFGVSANSGGFSTDFWTNVLRTIATLSSSTGTSASTSTPTYSAPQQGVQDTVANSLQQSLESNGYTPQLKAAKNVAAGNINKTYSGVSDRADKFLASRGFGKSGKVGQTQLQTSLDRAGAMAQNEGNFASKALDQWNNSLAAALAFAFANPGATTTGQTASTAQSNTTDTTNTTGHENGSEWGVSAGVGGGITGIKNVTPMVP